LLVPMTKFSSAVQPIKEPVSTWMRGPDHGYSCKAALEGAFSSRTF
jgi:hypothetical protein